MQIRFISGLTADEENELAPALLSAVTTLLDRFPLAYTLRIETSGNQVFQHSLPARPNPVDRLVPPRPIHADVP